MTRLVLVAVLAILLIPAVLAACSYSQSTSTTAPSPVAQTGQADVPLKAETVWTGHYKTDIQPIFDEYCVRCHGPAKAENGLRLDSYEGVMKGTRNGAVVIPGQPTISTLVSVIEGTTAPAIAMPHEGQRLSTNRIKNIRGWIEAGAKND